MILLAARARIYWAKSIFIQNYGCETIILDGSFRFRRSVGVGANAEIDFVNVRAPVLSFPENGKGIQGIPVVTSNYRTTINLLRRLFQRFLETEPCFARA